MRERANVKKWIWIPIVLMLMLIMTISTVVVNSVQANDTESLFNLNERDILLEVGGSKKLELESEEIKFDISELEVTWISSKPSVATVGKDGTITAAAGGETKITAIVEYEGKEYSTSCVVTVKAEGNEYSTYKIRWFTQKKDRSDYEIVEETYERLVGSDVELTQLDANKNRPSNYVLNTEKSTFTGKVKERLGACVLEVYFDVAEIQYSVDYYYESDTEFGTYPTKETKKYKAYAFTKVEVTEDPKAGFVINDKVSGTVKSRKSVVAGSKLKVYCDRIRSKVTVNYISEKADATYDCVYGVGLLNAPKDVFDDSIEYKITTYVNGEKKKADTDLMKTVIADTTVDFKLDGAGFNYSIKDGKSTITNKTDKKATPSYAVLKGSSDTLYLSATYKTTGSSSNTFGITLSNGKTSREIRFSKQGVAIMKDNTKEGGVLSSDSKTNAYRNAGLYNDGNVFVWAQNTKGDGSTVVSSVVNNMLKNREGGKYDICWAVLDGVLYCSVENQTVLRLPLTYLDETWTAEQKYEIGFSSYDASAWSDALKISNVKLTLGADAKALLKTETFDSALTLNMAYDALTGNYLPASKSGAAYMYTEETSENTGVSADVKWVDKGNTASAIGVTLKVGEKSYQYVVQGMNSKIRTQQNHSWGAAATRKDLKKQTLAEVTPFTTDGTAKVTAFVKDGYFHVLYNGVQAYCINMLSLYPEYTPETKVSVGLCSWDARLGLAEFSNVTELKAADIAAGIAGAEDWGFYAETGGLSADAYDFTAGSITKSTKKTNKVTLLGSNATWQIEGTMNRIDDTKADLLMGFQITAGENTLLITGRNNGFQNVANGVWPKKDNGYKGREYADSPSLYAFNNIVSNKFFNTNNTSTRTQEKIHFKAVLYNDILYVWFTDEVGNSGLCWRVPLKEEQFGGFSAGSSYEIALYMGNSDTDGSMTNLDVKMGYQVTDQTDFATDNSNTSYDFCEALETIDANIARWDDFKQKAIGGNLAEEIVTANNVGGKTVYAYLEEASTDIYLSTKIDITKPAKDGIEFFGITIRHGEEERGLFFNDYGVSLLSNSTDTANIEGIPALYKNGDATEKESAHHYAEIRNKYTYAEDREPEKQSSVLSLLTMKSGKEAVIEWAITDDVLYGRVNGFVFLRMPMEQLFDGYADWEKKEVQIGLVQRNIAGEGDLIYRDIDAYYGADALNQLNEEMELDDSLIGTVKGIYCEPFTGKYMPYADKTVYLTGKATDEAQVLTTMITSLAAKNTNKASYGFTVKLGDDTAHIVLQPNNGKVRFISGNDWRNEPVYKQDASLFNDQGVCELKAVINNHKVYIFYNNTLTASVDLYKILPGYVEGAKLELGVCARDAKNGLAVFSNITFAQGAEAVAGMNFEGAENWEVYTNASDTGTNMTYDREEGVVTPAADSEDAAYIYGVATSMDQKMEATITRTGTSANGITIASGEESVQFYVTGVEKKIKIINNYVMDGASVQVSLPETFAPAENTDGASSYNVTAIVKGDKLYLKYNENAVYSIALEKVFPGYQTGDSMKLGVCTWDAKNGASSFSNVSFEAGASVENMAAITGATNIEYLVKMMGDASVVDGVISKTSNKQPYVILKGASVAWHVKGTFTRTNNASKDLLAGFRITTDDNINNNSNNLLCVLGATEGVSFIGRNLTTGKGVWCNHYRYVGNGNKWVMGDATDIFSKTYSKSSVEFEAMIVDDVLYVWIDNVPVWRVALNEDIYCTIDQKIKFSKYADGTVYNFGFHMGDNVSRGTFSNLTVKTSVDDAAMTKVNAFKALYAVYEANGYQ